MQGNITLYSISEILGKNFFIPAYQRGYRWQDEQVTDLLADLYSFATKSNKGEKEFYCLQPIVVARCEDKVKKRNYLLSQLDDNIWYEIVDGQQRLTTLRILIAYLVDELYPGSSLYERHRKHQYNLEYETRKGCSAFIDSSEYSDETIDYYFISEARKSIKNWFDKNEKIKDPQVAKEKIRNTLLYTQEHHNENNNNEGVAKIIWYEISGGTDDTSVDTFIRINLGKIALTGAELIKALFLQERDFYSDNKQGVVNGENQIAKLKQLQIATEWDRIETSLHNEELWWFINQSGNEKSTRIDFLFDFIRIMDEPNVDYGDDDYASFRYYANKFDGRISFDNLKKEWEEIQGKHMLIQEWFSNPVWYHYIGFLIYIGVPIHEIYAITKNHFKTKSEITSKSEITDSLKSRIKHHFEKIETGKDADGRYLINVSYKPNDVKFIREFLLLYNIQYIVQQCQSRTVISKFPFKAFKKIKNENGEEMSWDVEHIDSFTTNKLPNRKDKIIWLRYMLEEIVENDNNAPLIERINEFIANEKSKTDFDAIQQELKILFSKEDYDEEIKNNIGNLALLDSGTNRGYGNALFPSKRRKIIEKDQLGVFVPICTKNVFLKYFNKSGTRNTEWAIEDMNLYKNHIYKTLEDFFIKD
ncbi:MAG: DUF262 domain-containing protein [Bacteroidota bacterium]